ncbi:hypothetical protein JS565_02580 [Salmonella enterica subsp. enterica serovar Senftenberg]|nr:hypothetical protein [Salmonella enterica subsp. enterica serovar Senftenberg]
MPRQRGDIARGGMEAILAKLRQRGGNELTFRLLALGGRGGIFITRLSLNQSID